MLTPPREAMLEDSLGEATFTEIGQEGRRRHPRHRVELAVDLGSEHNFYAGFVENVSYGGIFVATHRLGVVGEQLEIAIQLPNQRDPVRGVGEVRWLREPAPGADLSPGMGIRFLVLDVGGAEAIEAFIASRAPMFFDDD